MLEFGLMEDFRWWSTRKLLYIGVVLGIILPLSINAHVVRLFTWMIPGLILLFGFILRSIQTKNFTCRVNDIWSLSVIGLLVAVLANILFKDNFLEILPEAIGYCFVLLIGLHAKNSYGTNFKKEEIVKVVILFAAIQAGVSIIQQVTGTQFGNIQDYFGEEKGSDVFTFESLSRIKGTLGHPNLVANTLVLSLCVILYTKSTSTFFWLLKWLLVLAITISTIFTFSRASIGIMLLVFAIAFYENHLKNVSFKLNLKLNFIKTLFVLVFFIGVIAIMYQKIDLIISIVDFGIARINNAFESSSTTTSGSFRMMMNIEALSYMKNTILNGMGFNNSKYVWDFLQTPVPWWWRHQPHNIFVVFGLEGGLLGFVSGMIVHVFPLISLVSIRKQWDEFGSMLFLINICIILFGQIYLTPLSGELAPIVLFFMGITVGYSLQPKKESLNVLKV